MAEVKGQHGKKIFHIEIIILFCFSIIMFLLAWIVVYIYTKRYKKLKDIAKRNYPVNDKSASIDRNEGVVIYIK